MDKRKAYPKIKASDFGKSYKDLLKSFTESQNETIIDQLQEQTNRTLKKLVKEKRKKDFKVIRNDIKLNDTNGGNFGEIDEVTKDGIGNIKTISNEEFQTAIFNKGRKQDLSELNALMHNSKIKKGYIHYVNSDKPFVQATIKSKYDAEKYQVDLKKIKTVQAFVKAKNLDIVNNKNSVSSTLSESNFVSDFSKLQQLKEHSIVQAGLKANNPFIRNMRRESRPYIEGMQHGWFGKTRRLRTPFGSPYRLGSYEDIINLYQNNIEEIFGDSWAIDLETKSLRASHDSIIEAAFKRGGNYKALFRKQDPGFSLEKEAPFLAKSGFGDFANRISLDLTKPGSLPNFTEQMRAFHNSFKGQVEANVVGADAIIAEAEAFSSQAKASRKPIYIQNANFEIRQLNAIFAAKGKTNPIQYSPEYEKLRENTRSGEKEIFSQFKNKKLSSNQALNKLVENQKKMYVHLFNEAAKGGTVVDVQDIGRMLNAVSQSKGLQTATGVFGANTSIDYLAKIFINEFEIHEGVLDTSQQETLAIRMNQSIREIETGKIESKWTQSFLETNKKNALEIYKDSIRKSIASEIESGGNPFKIRNFNQLEVEGFNRKEIFEEVIQEFNKPLLQNTALKSNSVVADRVSENVKKARVGTLLFGGILLGSSITNLFKFSGSDEDYNTIEGLKHGSPTQNQRQYNTSFGSGYKVEKFHQSPQGQEEQEGMTWKQLGLTGLGATAAYGVFQTKANKTRLNDLTYLGKQSKDIDNETLMGRKASTVQDIIVAGTRRLENSFGGFAKAFGFSDVAAFGMYDHATFQIDLTTKHGETYAQYMNKLLNRKLIEEGVDSLMFKKGELFQRINGEYTKINGKFSLLPTVINYDLSDSISSIAKSAAYRLGISNVNDLKKQPFLILGGAGESKAFEDLMRAYSHETTTKPLKLAADPFEAFRQAFPDFEPKVTSGLKKVIDFITPDIGVDGQELVQGTRGMLKLHAGKLATFGALAYFGFGTLNFGSQYLAPDGTPLGDAGLIGVGAYTIRKGHELYARFSDTVGLTSLRDMIEEKAPGSDGFQTTVGLTGAGAMFGALYGSVQDITGEASSDEKYKTFLKSKEKTEEFQGTLGKIFKEKYTKTGKSMRIGAAAGFLAALPFTIAGLGADTDATTLAAEYAGEKEVAVRKGRFWETGFTPFEGGEIDYYRPNWYARLMDNAKNKELYGGDVSPIGQAIRSITDPYWLEKRRYHSQPYPITGPDGSMMGIFGPMYEASIGRILKPVAEMHKSVYPEEIYNNTEYDIDAMLRKQWNSTLEFMGLRGFAVKALKENITGSQEIFPDPNETRSAKDIDSIVKDFYDLQLGGGFLTTEALRRVFQSQDSFQKAQIDASVNLNPIKNTMPSWMPGSDYITDFKSGDPFLKVKDGYYRLPGAGFASRYEGLEGVDPENYADIYKYKILADIGYGSGEFRAVKGRLQNRQLTDYEQDIYDEVEAQVREKKESEINVRDPRTYDSILGRYSAFLTDLARSNPLETLLPISPAHKFLGPPDVEDFLDEQRYSKEYRSWANPIDDFIMPAISMTMNSVGLGGIDVNDDPAIYQDKMDFLEYSNLARQAQAAGDLRSADKYTLMAQKTYTGKDLYRHYADVGSSMPQQERKVFNYFVASDVATKQKMIGKVNPRYRDAYQAQLDMQMMEDIERSQIGRSEKRKMLNQIRERQQAIEARRKASIQDLRGMGRASQQRGSGRRNYIDNRARDYHDYQPVKSATDSALAVGQIPASIIDSAAYSSHYSSLNNAGIKNALVVLRPGLDNSAKVNVTVDRTEERNSVLRDWGYIK